MEESLRLKSCIKAKKPTFRRQDSHKKPRIKENWRRPKGSDSKMRRGLRGYLRSPEPGWGSPRDVMGLTKYGLRPVQVSNMKDIESLDPKKDCAVIKSTVGIRKRIELIKKLLDMKISIDNIRDPLKYIKDTDSKIKARKQKKEEEKKAKEKKKKDKPEKEKKEGDLAEKVDTEEHKKIENKEKEKIITKK